MKKKTTPQVDALTSAQTIATFREYAKELKKENTIKAGLASAIIYSNLAEYLASSLLLTIKANINLKLNFKDFWLSKEQKYKEEPTNLEYLISQLTQYRFPLEAEIKPLLAKIKDQRNKLFHNLLIAKEKGLKPNSLVRNIQNDTEKLLTLYFKFYKVISPIK